MGAFGSNFLTSWLGFDNVRLDMNDLLQLDYWFTMQPANVGGIQGKILFGVFLAVFIFGIVAKIVTTYKTEDKYVKLMGERISSLLVSMGLVGVLLYFFSFERIWMFGARFWYVIWVAIFLIWLYYIVRYIKKDIPSMRMLRITRERKWRYFPPRKKKKKKR